MPTYQYECSHCKHSFEKFQQITDKSLKKCPQCNHKSLTKLIGSGGAIIFKGPGFYVNDYKKSPDAKT